MAVISFLQMLAARGTLSVVILYTNQMFHWTEYEDGIMFSLASLVRLFTMLVVLPILVHFHQRAYRNKKSRVNSKAGKGVQTDGMQPNDGDPTHQQDPFIHSMDTTNQALVNANDPDAAASAQYLGEAAIEFSSDDHDAQERRNRQTSVDSTATLSSSTNIPNNSRNDMETDASVASARTREETFSDMKFDTWMIRLGLAVSAFTYVGYGLASEGWLFILAVSLHAICIIASPSLKSLLAYLVEPSQFGAVLGAIQVVESIAAIFSPVAISWVYALTVKSMPEFVWYSCAAWIAICVVLSFMIRQKQFRNNMDA
ncbi:hypothetical protein BGZ58_008152 [Dissophora ornata]|nr:hypothetical protein BGZ58_008152 [Dissophora ornata]